MTTFYIGAGMLLAGIVIGLVLARVFEAFRNLQERIKALEDCQKKRLPYATAAGVEDALAVNMDLVRQANELEIQAQVLRRRAAQQEDILRLVRGGPDNYPVDRPAGRRPE